MLTIGQEGASSAYHLSNLSVPKKAASCASCGEVNDTRYAIISVQDSGMGIPPDQLEQIFDRNYKVDRPGVETGVEGSGLGLTICREIVQAHGGMVRAESDGKTGAIFYVSLPCMVNEGR
ncbi:ATP-binding protein [Paenibacillus sp. J5C_2022]|uniref:sensor histidine kinase n=1 Tax=Paenibacillus sp. J5C2022 TaxID=2977129 RepID=UPI0021D0D01F|nr:ATP-binding protein [Paenibacillus sp. J5C2022]MCU6711043.1 ATP-binding protein [Paenibacillus sp. J5C2022]